MRFGTAVSGINKKSGKGMGNQTIPQLKGYAQAERLCVAADKPGAQGGFVRILTTRNLKKNTSRRIKWVLLDVIRGICGLYKRKGMNLPKI